MERRSKNNSSYIINVCGENQDLPMDWIHENGVQIAKTHMSIVNR
jgi:hypothetical protein